MVFSIPPPLYAPPLSPVSNDSSEDLEALYFDELEDRFFSANEDERKEILIVCIRNYSDDAREFDDYSIPQGILNTLMQNAFYDCCVSTLHLPLLRYGTLVVCLTDNRWIEEIDIDSLDGNLTDASPHCLNYLAELLDHRFQHIIKHEDAEEEDVQHWERYCRAGVVIANHALTHHREYVKRCEFEPMIVKLAQCAGRGIEIAQSKPHIAKIFQNILEELLTFVTSKACREYLDLEVEVRVREELVYASELPNPEAQEHFPFLILLLEKMPTRSHRNGDLAKTIFSHSSDLEISLRAAQQFCYDPIAIEFISKIVQLNQMCLQNTVAVDQKILEIAAFMGMHLPSIEKISWTTTPSWWDEIENHVCKDQKNRLKIIRLILVGKGRKEPGLVQEATGLCLFTFFDEKDRGNLELLKEVLSLLRDEKNNYKYAFIHALAPAFFREAADIIYEKSGGNYGYALRCICLAGGLKDSQRAFEFIYTLFKLERQQAFGELCFAMFQAFNKGNALLFKDRVKANQYLDKSREYHYKTASRSASLTFHRVQQQHALLTDDFLKPEKNPTQLFCKEMKQILVPFRRRDQNGHDPSRFSESVEHMTMLFLKQDSELDRQYVLDYMKKSSISPIIGKVFDTASSEENSPEIWNCRLLLGLVNWHLRPDIHEEDSGVRHLRFVAEKAPESTSRLAKNRAGIFLRKYCDANFNRAEELLNGDTVEEAKAAYSYALAACFGGYKGGSWEAIIEVFKAKITATKISDLKAKHERRQLLEADKTLAEVGLTEYLGIENMRRMDYLGKKIKAYASPQEKDKLIQDLKDMLKASTC
ncbi:MAG: hypothetical protein WB791_05830 [Waddliaceae bacterium]